jgi:coproporphyrinogen III oxidase
MTETFDSEKAAASAWFHQLRDDIVARFEAIEAQHEIDAPCGTFTVTPTQRTAEDGSDAGGGLMSVMRGGRVFEKVGVNVSTVFGTLGARVSLACVMIQDFGRRAFHLWPICKIRIVRLYI